VDFQPRSFLPRVCLCDRLELHDQLANPSRSRGITHSVACLEDTRNHEPDIFPLGTWPAPIGSESGGCARSSAPSSRGKRLCYFESLRSLTRVSLFSNTCNSRLLWPRKSSGLPCLRPIRGRTRLSVLGGALLRYSHTGSLDSCSWNLTTSHPLR
jgi:hypothetical protein